MQKWPRREFLGASFTGVAAASGVVRQAWAKPTPDSQQKEQQAQSQRPAPDTLILTWQSDPTTTITCQWLDFDPPAKGAVHIAEWDKADWTRHQTELRPYQKTDLKLHRCELTGLKPDTEYQLRVSGTDTICRFRTMPAKMTDTVQFVSGGDSGIYRGAMQTNKIAAAQDPRFAFLGGDLAYDNGTKPETFTTFLRNWHSQMVDSEGRLIPILSCIGNHELGGGYLADRSNAPQYLSFFDGLYRETTYGVLDIGDYLSLVLLDSGHICPIPGEQTDWLEKTLAAREDRQHVIVAYHVPAYPSFRDLEKPGSGQLQREHWCPLLERYKVDLVLEHHDHTFKRCHPLTNGLYDKHGVLYLGDGSWGKLRAIEEPSLRPYLAKVASFNHCTVHRLEGDDRYHVALNSRGQVADVCHTVSKRPARRG